MNTNEIYEQLAELWTQFSVEHAKSSKAAHTRARKTLSEIKNLIKEYRSSSILEDKQK
jgi:hypothetical protein